MVKYFNPITQQSINSIREHRYITSNTEYARKYNKNTYNAIIRLMTASKFGFNSGEVALLMDNKTFECYLYSSNSIYGVDLSDIMMDEITHGKKYIHIDT